MTTLALTGATGFVGGHLLRLALDANHDVLALTRRGGEDRAGLTWIPGTLADPPALARLVEGADAVLHVAGVVNAHDRAGFEAGNVAGTAAMLAAARDAGVARFVLVSSLAAREPGLSDYGASKARAEALVEASGLDWTIVRPPAVYGPGDREMLELFRMARRGVVPLPPGGRLSIIHAEDLCRLLLALVPLRSAPDTIVEPDDGLHEGWTHSDLARVIGAAVGRRAIPLPMPRGLLRAASLVDGLVRRGGAKLTRDRVGIYNHPDWVVRARPALDLWRPAIDTRAGMKATADWYRAERWL